MKVSAASVSALVMVLVQALVPPAAGYSLDQDHSLEFKGPPSSMFGYSVLLYRHNTESWSGSLLVFTLLVY